MMTVFAERVEAGKIGIEQAESRVRLLGWVQRRRDHGGLIFVDLRDRSGLIQVVFNPEMPDDGFSLAERLRSEFVVSIYGCVKARPEGTVNKNLLTGEIEIVAETLDILNAALTPPFYILDNVDVDETVRLKHRYLDLRRPEMQRVFKIRHQVTQIMRNYLDSKGFWEVETPILQKSSPEGARDFLVPSRIHPGEFYALPQSPQIFKQILMVSGIEKYFQIARCFRDEDLRADRQPEFTQLDIEMSFVEIEDILPVMEEMIKKIFTETAGLTLDKAFPRLTYVEALDRFGSDKPDTRFSMELVDVADLVKDSGFKVFTDVLTKGGRVKGICAKGCAAMPRRDLDDLSKYVNTYGPRSGLYCTRP